ncbi:alpha/beta fold hydrolase [Alkalinema pantanalense CENA528]|uniref:alpha/beta fold hydrolase n=1 Tax=Alkalinema pantanalense TaxID=1620705 RepID=UPI003D6F6A96
MTVAPLNRSFELRTWSWQGHHIQYTVVGNGQPIVLLHGFGASIGHWRKNIPVLAESGYQVFALDLLGFGASDKPALDYSMELWQGLVQDFCRELVPTPAVFVGNSIGGLLTLMVMANSPELSRGGVLLNPAGGLNHRPDELNFPLRLILGSFAKLASSDLVGVFLFNQVRKKHRIRNSLRQVYRNPDAITDELVELLHRPSCDPGAQKVFASILSAPAGPRPQDLLPQVKEPLLVLWGEEDPWTPIQGSTLYQQLRDQIQFQAIPRTGHCPHDERPEIVNQKILAWLNQHGW